MKKLVSLCLGLLVLLLAVLTRPAEGVYYCDCGLCAQRPTIQCEFMPCSVYFDACCPFDPQAPIDGPVSCHG
jgi:hypothetical protein